MDAKITHERVLPVLWGNILTKYNKVLFDYFFENDSISHNQSGFKPGDSCINKLLSITREICKSFDEGYDTRGVFLDISKAFNKVLRRCLLHKLEENDVSGN